MCYNISNNNKDKAKLQKALGASYPQKLGKLKLNYSVSGFTHPEWPVITIEKPKEFQLLRWGLIPYWTPNAQLAKQFKVNNLNSKSETIFEKRSFSKPILNNRCLIPVTGFFEWRTFMKKKYPYHIQLRDEEIFCLGGIYDEWTDKETGEIVNSFSIVTTVANPLMVKIHNLKLRMPLIIPKEKASRWLNTSIGQSDINEIMKPLDDKLMKATTISKRITSKTEDPNNKQTIEFIEYPELNLFDS